MSRLSDARFLSKVSCGTLVASVLACAVYGIFMTLSGGEMLSGALVGGVSRWAWLSVANIAFIQLTAVCLFSICVHESRGEIREARSQTRVAILLLVVTCAASIVINGITWLGAFYVAQMVCVVSYQVINDPNLGDNVPWSGLGPLSRLREAFISPFWMWKHTPNAFGAPMPEQEYREHYMPLNVFNLLWVFVVGSLCGCLVEDGWHILTEGVFQERAGLVWGPLTPIYGCGAVCLTVCLNRVWRSSWWRVFLVAGVVGCLVEYVTSWYLERSVGVVAWDYSGTFGNIGGRVNVFFFFAWGTLGLLWVRLLLPVVMRVVDAIPVRARAVVTSFVFGFLLVDVTMTSLALDGWSKRHLGIEPAGEVETWVAANFDDAWMGKRFEKMDFGDEAVHVEVAESGIRFF